MILILSSVTDFSTRVVMRWLDYLFQPFCLITPKYETTVSMLSQNKFCINYQDKKIKSNEITSFWYRRGHFYKDVLNKTPCHSFCIDYLEREKNSIFSYLYFLLDTKRHINSYITSEVNKLYINFYAQEVGLNIPNYILTTQKNDLLEFMSRNTKCIVKPASEGFSPIHIDNAVIAMYAALLEKKDVDGLPDNFFLSFIQVYIEKKYELRIFYFMGECHTMAIFSQNDEQTKVDFRQYNETKPNRNVPFLLPNEIQNKVNELMIKIGINCGSIDMGSPRNVMLKPIWAKFS